MIVSRRSFLKAAGGMAALLLPTPSGGMQLPVGTLYAVTGTVLVGDGTPPMPDHAVLVTNGLIKAVLPVDQVRSPEVLMFPGTFIMPGVINCHTHRIHTAEERRNRHLMHGVTSIGDPASPTTKIPEFLDSPVGTTTSAACSGPMLCPTGGYPLPVHSPEHGLVVTSPEQGRERVRQLADLGVTMIKFAFEPGPYTEPWPLFDIRTAQAVCDEARKRSLTIRCHVEDFGGLETALDAGVHSIEHVPHRWIANGAPQKILIKGNDVPIAAYRKQLERMVREGVILTPTLDVLSRSMWNGPELYEPVRYFAEQGGKIAVGNDHPYRRTDAGMPLKEMQLLTRSGLDNRAILTAGTKTSAEACGFENKGQLKKGMAADMLILESNPLDDLDALSMPLHIIKDGLFVR